jgi:hypothetical protein
MKCCSDCPARADATLLNTTCINVTSHYHICIEVSFAQRLMGSMQYFNN